jgi:ParB family chromosome partitioning protein
VGESEKDKKAGGGQLLDGMKRISSFEGAPEELVIIGVDTDDGPEHELFDERADTKKKPLKEESVLSMMALGVLQVAKVVVLEIATKTDKTVKRRAVVVDGRRRVLHAREANRRLREKGEPELTMRIEAANGKRVSEEFLALAMIAMNELRESDEILVKAAKAERMVARGIDKRKVAIAFGVVPQTIDAWLKIRSAGPAVRKALESGQLEATAAAAIAELPKDEQAAAVEQAVAQGGGKATVANAKAVVRAAKEKKAGGDGEVRSKPGGRLLTKIVEYSKVNEVEFPEGFLLGVQYAKGDLDPKRVKGLAKVIRELEQPTKV